MAGVAILHGWSDEGKNFASLRTFLDGKGIAATDVWLGNYISLDDDVRVEDVAKRMQVVVRGMLDDPDCPLKAPFNLITHSTGALVAREWLATFYPDGKDAPVKRIVMLAPANFGSVLAAVGKSMIGRLFKGFGNGFQTGEEMLRALELGSPYQWNLTSRDLLSRRPSEGTDSPFGPDKVWPFVIVGSRGYDEGLRQVVNEDASDGTVRVPAANINCVGMTLDFSQGADPVVTPWASRMGMAAPFAVLPERDHSEITHPEQNGDSLPPFADRLADLVLGALRCPDKATYAKMEQDWQAISNQTAMLALNPQDAAGQAPLESPPPQVVTLAQVFGALDPHATPHHFNRYLQVNVVVRDDYGQLVEDYFLEFADPNDGDGSAISFHRDVLKDVHADSVSSAYRCLFINHTALLQLFYKQEENAALGVSISAAPPGKNVKYFNSKTDTASGQIKLHAADVKDMKGLSTRLFRNRTHFVEVIIPRRPVDDVFSFLT